MAEIKQSDIPNQAKRKKSLGIFIVILLILSITCTLYWFFFLKDFEETEDEVKHYEVFDKNIVIVPTEFYNLVKEKIMPAA